MLFYENSEDRMRPWGRIIHERRPRGPTITSSLQQFYHLLGGVRLLLHQPINTYWSILFLPDWDSIILASNYSYVINRITCWSWCHDPEVKGLWFPRCIFRGMRLWLWIILFVSFLIFVCIFRKWPGGWFPFGSRRWGCWWRCPWWRSCRLY